MLLWSFINPQLLLDLHLLNYRLGIFVQEHGLHLCELWLFVLPLSRLLGDQGRDLAASLENDRFQRAGVLQDPRVLVILCPLCHPFFDLEPLSGRQLRNVLRYEFVKHLQHRLLRVLGRLVALIHLRLDQVPQLVINKTAQVRWLAWWYVVDVETVGLGNPVGQRVVRNNALLARVFEPIKNGVLPVRKLLD